MKELILKTKRTNNYLCISNGGSSIPIVFLHGFTGTHHSWDEVVLKLNRYTIALDLPGHGKSSFNDIKDNYSIDDWCDDFYKVLSLLNIEKIDLCGYSMGGRLAIAFASKYPIMINKLILESASYGIRNKKDRADRLAKDLKLSKHIESDLHLFIEKWENSELFSKQEHRNPRMFLKQRQQRLLSNPAQLAKALKSFSQGGMFFYAENILKFEFPVIIINGSEDSKYIKIGQRIDSFLADSSHFIVSKCGHNVHLEQFDKFISILGG